MIDGKSDNLTSIFMVFCGEMSRYHLIGLRNRPPTLACARCWYIVTRCDTSVRFAFRGINAFWNMCIIYQLSKIKVKPSQTHFLKLIFFNFPVCCNPPYCLNTRV